MHALVQFREPRQHQTRVVLGVHLVIGKKPQILQHAIAQGIGLIDDEQGRPLGRQGQPCGFCADDAEGAGSATFDG